MPNPAIAPLVIGVVFSPSHFREIVPLPLICATAPLMGVIFSLPQSR